MKFSLHLAVILILNAYCFKLECQVKASTQQKIIIGTNGGEVRAFTNEKEMEIIGSPFFNQGFNIGSIYFFNRNLFDSVPILFDLYNNEIGYYKASTKDTILLVKDYIHQFIIFTKNTSILFKKININAGKNKFSNYQFVKVIYEGERFNLYRYLYCKVLKEMDLTGVVEQAVIKNEKKLLLLENDKYKISELRKNKAILKYFDDKKDEMKVFIKNNNLKLKTDKDLLTVLSYYKKISD